MSQDTLSEVLRQVRLRGAMFFHVACETPWVVEAPSASKIAAAVMPGADHVMAYHVVTRGACWGAVVGEPPVRAERGDVIVFAHGNAHTISSAPGMRAASEINPLALLPPDQLPFYIKVRGNQMTLERPQDSDSPDRTELACGFFGCDARPFNPLIASLPPLLHIRAPDNAQSSWLAQFIRVTVEESAHKRPGGEALLERLSEMMFVDLMRRYIDGLPEDQTGWLAGLRDRFVGRALALLHERPAQHWTIETLADRVGLSRSTLHDRFVQFTGQPPMQYLTGWRMQLASGLLTHTGASVSSVALDVGYESEAAFGRAFKRATGVPPGRWRRERVTG